MLPPVPKKMIQRWVVIGVSVLENCRQCFEPRCPTKPAIRYSSCESEPDLNCIIHHQLLMAFIKPSPANNAPRSRHHRGFWMKHFLRLCTVCEREAVQRRGNVQMRQKERIPRVADAWSEFILTMLAEDLFGAICHRLVRFPSSHSLHCYALSRERKSPEKVGDLWKIHTMTDPIWMTGTNSLKRTTFGILWPTEQEDVFDPLSWTSWDFFSLIWSLLRWKQWQYGHLQWLESNCSMVLQSL